MGEIDTIYDLFIWSSDYNEDEYRKRVQQGIELAASIKNLYPFIQPIVLPCEKSKSTWEGCAMVVSLRNDKQLKPYLHLLFEWLQDMNWPGAWIIFDRLSKMPYEAIQEEYKHAVNRAKKDNDQLWLMALNDFKKVIDNNGLWK